MGADICAGQRTQVIQQNDLLGRPGDSRSEAKTPSYDGAHGSRFLLRNCKNLTK